MKRDELDETIDSLLESGLIVCVGYDEKGEELYALKEDALKRGLKIYPSLEKKSEKEIKQ